MIQMDDPVSMYDIGYWRTFVTEWYFSLPCHIRFLSVDGTKENSSHKDKVEQFTQSGKAGSIQHWFWWTTLYWRMISYCLTFFVSDYQFSFPLSVFLYGAEAKDTPFSFASLIPYLFLVLRLLERSVKFGVASRLRLQRFHASLQQRLFLLHHLQHERLRLLHQLG